MKSTDIGRPMTTRASIVIVGFGAEAYLEDCLDTASQAVGPADEILLLDNGIDGASERRSAWPESVRVLEPGKNLGFAAGVNHAVRASYGEYIVLLNSDALVQARAIDAIVDAANQEATLATGCLRLASAPELVNSAGNPMHYTGLCWAGAYGEPAERHDTPRQVATASGGLMALRRSLWDSLEGFNELYFAYQEDAELSARVWLMGGQVVYAPDAVAYHHYEFSRHSQKMYLLERNRLITVLTVFPPSLRRRVTPALLMSEAGLVAVAASQGWLRQKLETYRWLWSHRRDLRHRRSVVQRLWVVDADALTPRLSARVDPAMIKSPPLMSVLNAGMSAYWRMFSGQGVRRG